MAKIQSVEPNIADLANGWLKSYKLDYKLEQESLNTEIDQALNDYYSKNGGVGGNRPDAKLLLQDNLKKTEKEKIETTASVATESLNRSQQRSNSNAIRAKIKEAVAASGKQYDGIKEIIDMVRQIIPYNRMLISSDGYLIPLDDRYFRIDAQNLGFKYGGEITCVGMITNIIGEDTDPNDSQNIFATLQFSVNEVLRQLLPTKERNLCVIHPIAVYYGN